MGIVQVIIDRTTSMTIEGIYEFDREDGGTLIAPAGTAFPSTPVACEWFWNTTDGLLYRRDEANTEWIAVGSGSAGYITTESHAALRQLVHLAEGVGGPMEAWTSGAVRETLPAADPFPQSVTWYIDGTKTKKIVQKLISYNANKTPATIQWSAYDVDGTTVLAQVTDTVSYSGVFELTRTRTHT